MTTAQALTDVTVERDAQSDDAALRAELIQVAAAAVKWVEIIDARTAGQDTGSVKTGTEWGVKYGETIEPADSEYHATVLSNRLFPDDTAGEVVSRQVLQVRTPWKAQS